MYLNRKVQTLKGTSNTMRVSRVTNFFSCRHKFVGMKLRTEAMLSGILFWDAILFPYSGKRWLPCLQRFVMFFACSKVLRVQVVWEDSQSRFSICNTPWDKYGLIALTKHHNFIHKFTPTNTTSNYYNLSRQVNTC